MEDRKAWSFCISGCLSFRREMALRTLEWWADLLLQRARDVLLSCYSTNGIYDLFSQHRNEDCLCELNDGTGACKKED